ncbi:MAG: transglycosylase domain-containing protein [Propionibacteriaceae bacterium]|jgi:membrane peptidoglycan carboxypeptidase|nr:transglycosylase domain-containing protein [Propionibacteriaceae bacterium]
MAEAKKAAPRRQAGKKRKHPAVRVLQWFGITLLVVLLLAGVAVIYLWSAVTLPDPNEGFTTNTTIVYYNDGKTQLGTFQVQNRRTITYEEIPQDVINALVASENRTFWTDPGFDLFGITRAVFNAVFSGDELTGASTITQQYVKVFYLSQERTVSRKVQEIVLAAKIGQSYSKEEIITNYLNTVYYGRGAYGIEAAALAYFKKSASELTLAESAVLTSIINDPNRLDPASGEDERQDLLERYQYTLNSMVEMDYITPAQRDAIYDDLPEFPEIKKSNVFGGTKGFLLNMVLNELTESGKYTEAEVTGGGLRITSTFDKADQSALNTAAKEFTLEAAGGDKKKAADLHAGVASVDNNTGEVLAIYGGPDFVANSRNWATTPRPVGSTFKPYALTAALEQGWVLTDRVNGSSFTPEGDPKPVRNAGGRNYGSITLLKATTNSVNSAYVDLTQQLDNGGQDVLDAAEAAGVPDLPDRGWSPVNNRVALGTPEISPLNQAGGYSTFANYGKQVTVHVVREVKDSQGEVLSSFQPSSARPFDEDVMRDLNYALSKVAQDGTGSRAAALGYPVAGKTGTAWYNDPKSGLETKTVAAWFVGYTRQITTAVMFVAGDDGMGNLDDYTRGFYGSGYPARLWLEYMKTAMEGKEKIQFEPQTGKKSERYTPKPKKTETETPDPTPSESEETPDPTPTKTKKPKPSETATSTATAAPTVPVPDPTATEPQPQPTETQPQPADTTQPAESAQPQAQTAEQTPA